MKLDPERSRELAQELNCQVKLCQRNTVRATRLLLDRGERRAVAAFGKATILNSQGRTETQDHMWVEVGELIIDPTFFLLEAHGFDFRHAKYFKDGQYDSSRLWWLEKRLGIKE